MSKELIERLRMMSADTIGNDAADALESLEADRDSWERQAGDRLDDVLRIVAERDALAAELKAVRGDQTPTSDDINLQEWKGMDGACAWHLIDRHAEDWHHTARLMNAWLEANREDLAAELKAAREQEPVNLIHMACIDDGELRLMTGKAIPAHDCELYAMPGGKSRPPLYAHPVPARKVTDAIQAIGRRSTPMRADEGHSPLEFDNGWNQCLDAIERYLKGEGE